MDGSGDHYAKWNKPVSERQIPYDLTYEQSNEQNKLTNKIEPETWKHGTLWTWPDGRWEGDNGGKKGKGLDKEHLWMTHGHRQQCGDWLWGVGVGWAEEGEGGKIGTTVIE